MRQVFHIVVFHQIRSDYCVRTYENALIALRAVFGVPYRYFAAGIGISLFILCSPSGHPASQHVVLFQNRDRDIVTFKLRHRVQNIVHKCRLHWVSNNDGFAVS